MQRPQLRRWTAALPFRRVSKQTDHSVSLLARQKGAGRLVVAILGLHACLLVWSGWVHSPVVGENAHLAAGLSHLKLQRFDLFRVNPPLVRVVAAAAILPAGPATNWHRYDLNPLNRSEGEVAADFVRANGAHSRWLFASARWSCLLFSLGGAFVCYRWSRRLYGDGAGVLTVVLWCFSPAILGHASLITPDAHAAAAGVAAAYTFWCWLTCPKWQQACLAGLVLGVAQLCKFTLLVFYPVWIAIWLLTRRRDGVERGWRRSLREAGQLALIVGLSVYVVNAGYLFEGSLQRLGEYRFQSRLFTGMGREETAPAEGANRFTGTWLGRWPVPFPRNYLQGIDAQRWDFERGKLSYLRGKWRHRGWWWYYVYAMMVKVPLGTSVLFLLAVGMTLFGRALAWRYSAGWRDEMMLIAPAAAVLVLVSSQTGFNHHMRYALPAFPFLFVWVGKVGRTFVLGHRITALVVVGALSWSVQSSLSVFPHSLSYFNELTRGPRNGYEHLLNSNIDWGEDLLYLKGWLNDHPDVQFDGLVYSGTYPPKLAGIPETPFPPRGPDIALGDPRTAAGELGPKPGWYAMSVNEIREPEQRYAYFLRFRPVAMAGYSIYIYHVTPEEANRVRRGLGLPPLGGGS